MTDRISRRLFVTGVTAGGLIVSAGRPRSIAAVPDIAVAQGTDAEKNTRAVVEALGGIKKFVRPGQRVLLLPNSQGKHPGASTDAGVIRAVAELCRQAGAQEISCVSWLPQRSWDRSGLGEVLKASGVNLELVAPDDPGLWTRLEIPRGKTLRQVRMTRILFERDVLISLPIFKDHIGSRFTGTLKNYMGTSHPEENKTFHPSFEGKDVDHMEQCIADLNTVVRKADLYVVSAMRVLTTNGPFGPGEVASPSKVVAGCDPVAVDTYGAGLLNLRPDAVKMIAMAHQHGLGEIDPSRVSVQNLQTS